MRKLFFIFSQLLIAGLLCAQQSALDTFLNDPITQHANVSVLVKDLTTNRVVAQHRAEHLTPPASIMKIVTTATALELFGANYRYTTLIQHSGTIDNNGTLHGNIYIVGSGDPTLGSAGNDLAYWAGEIKKAGINKIEGDIIADISLFDTENINPSWIWEDIGNYYAPGIFAIAYHSNSMSLTLQSNGTNMPVIVASTTPTIDSLQFHITATNSTAIPKTDIYVRGLPLSNIRYISGNMGGGVQNTTVSCDIPNPPLLLASDFAKQLLAKGITLTGHATFQTIKDATSRTTLLEHKSPTLAEIVEATNFRSNNMYAEHLFRLIGTYHNALSTRDNAIEQIHRYWRPRVQGMAYNHICDGSGLSPVDRLTAASLVDLLTYMTNSRNSTAFYNSLPIAGQQGTVRFFLVRTPLEGKTHVKSGTTSRIKSYAGYTQGPSGHKYAFAVIVADQASKARQVQPLIETLLVNTCK